MIVHKNVKLLTSVNYILSKITCILLEKLLTIQQDKLFLKKNIAMLLSYGNHRFIYYTNSGYPTPPILASREPGRMQAVDEKILLSC
jgi:hypothetical protein